MPATPPPDNPSPGPSGERFTLTISCPTAALITIALAIIAAILIAHGFDPSPLATLQARP